MTFILSPRLIGAATLGLGLLLTGCAAPVTQRVSVDAAAQANEAKLQQQLALRSMAEQQFRLLSVGRGVLAGGASECGEQVRPSLGFMVLSRDQLPANERAALSEALGLDSRLRVMAVYKGSPAQKAGLLVGDIVTEQSAAALTPPGESRTDAARRLSGPATFTVMRAGAPVVLTATAQRVCEYPLKVVPGSVVNAYADGKAIFVTQGMMRFAADDRELALVVAHELGHNVMGHITKKTANMALGTVVDIVAAAYGVNTGGLFGNVGAGAYSQDFESEADYVGLYYLAHAGYDTRGAADFWRRMAVESPASIKGSHAASHPATSERFLALEKVDGVIRVKRDAGVPLVPNRKQ